MILIELEALIYAVVCIYIYTTLVSISAYPSTRDVYEVGRSTEAQWDLYPDCLQKGPYCIFGSTPGWELSNWLADI